MNIHRVPGKLKIVELKKVCIITGLYFKSISILLFFICSLWRSALAQEGSPDASFNTYDVGYGKGQGSSSSITKIVAQSDGKILIGGSFTSFNGTVANRIARLNADATFDSTFVIGAGMGGGTVHNIAIQGDGKILVSGNFITYNTITVNHIVRLHEDGSLDTSFNPSGTGANGNIYGMAMQSDGKILIAGQFSSYNGTPRNSIARLNTDGTLDATFNPGTGPNDPISVVKVQSDGKILIGGDFSSYSGNTRRALARLNANGSLDNTFLTSGGANEVVSEIEVQSDGKIVIAGAFSTYSGTIVNGIARIDVNGVLDPLFNSGTGLALSSAPPDGSSIVIQNDGKILLGGWFDGYNGLNANNIIRLNPDGSQDLGFNPSGTGADGYVSAITLLSDGSILFGGNFASYNDTPFNRLGRLTDTGLPYPGFNPITGAGDIINKVVVQRDKKLLIGGFFKSFNGTLTPRIARLNVNGDLDTDFAMSSSFIAGVNDIAIQEDEKILVGGYFSNYNGTTASRIVRLNLDGSTDATFNSATGFDGAVRSIAIQNDGKILAGGSFSNFNGSSANAISRLNPDGSRDASFNNGSGFNKEVFDIEIQNDGKILVVGRFSSYNGQAINQLIRLNADGSEDLSFDVGSGFQGDYPVTIELQDGKILVGGDFVSYNGIVSRNIVRLNPNGSFDSTFNVGTGFNGEVEDILIQRDRNILIVGHFTSYNGSAAKRIARLHANGSLDTDFDPGTGSNNDIETIARQDPQKVIIAGGFISYSTIGKNGVARVYSTDDMLPPSNLKAIPGNNKASLSWQAATGATEYNIYRRTVSGTVNKINTAPVTLTSYIDTTAINGTIYYYSLSAVNINAVESIKGPEKSAAPDGTIPVINLGSPIKVTNKNSFNITVAFSEDIDPLTIDASKLKVTNGFCSTLTAGNTPDTYIAAITALSDGAVTMLASTGMVKSIVGNVNAPSNDLNITVDTRPPVVTGVINNESVAPGNVITFDEGTATLNGEPFGSGTPVDQEGTLTLVVTDQAGNTTEVTFLVIKKINTAPTLAAIDNKTICYTTEKQSITLSGITAGTETDQAIKLKVSTDKPGFFELLELVHSGFTATLNYQLKAGSSGTALITVTVKDDGGITNGGIDSLSRSFTLTANALPQVSVSSSAGTTINKGQTITLTATGGSQYQWSNGETGSTITVRPEQDVTYNVIASSSAACMETASITISVKNNLVPNNILTPNGDGKNDYLYIGNLDMFPYNEIRIYDSLGQVLYQAKQYHGEWDGVYQDSLLAEGTYYYVINFSDNAGVYTYKGFVTLIR